MFTAVFLRARLAIFWLNTDMEELSLHILDIVQNSIAAEARLVGVEVIEDEAADLLDITVTDDGKGMDSETLEKVTDPFTTGRKTRRVGLGIPLLKLASEMTGGGLTLESEPGRGTKISARFGYSHIDRQPLGDMASTIHQLVTANENVDFKYVHRVGGKEFCLDTREVKEILGGVPLNTHEVMVWLLDFLRENEEALYVKEI